MRKAHSHDGWMDHNRKKKKEWKFFQILIDAMLSGNAMKWAHSLFKRILWYFFLLQTKSDNKKKKTSKMFPF